MLWVFDVNETMLDLTRLDEVFSRHTGRVGLVQQWFELLIHAALVSAATGEYHDFAQLGADSARAITRASGVEFDDSALAELAATMRSLPAHPDVADGLAALRAHGHRLVALANSPHAVVDTQLAHAGLAELFDRIYSVEDAGALKPAPAPYRHVLDTEQTDARQAVMVAAHDWDIAGAQAVGMRTVFVARGNRTPLPAWPAPDAVIPDLTSAATALPD